MILIDTGPLVALFDPKDRDFGNCHRVLAEIEEPLFTTEAVLAETLHTLEPASKGADALMDFILQGYSSVVSLDRHLLERCFELINKYSDFPLDFADATLLALAEKYRTQKIFTLDFQDFRAYKVKKGHRYYSPELVGWDLLE